MKTILFFVSLALFFSCSFNPNNSQQNEIALGDTIQTPSGLKYIYLKKGEGLKVEPGCEVGTFLSLMVSDSVVWTSMESPDSLFTFIAGFTRLIKGFTEVTMLLREGDEIIAILPDSLAYGAKGAGDVIPPHATLIYDQFKVVKVGKSKAILADSLYATFKLKGFDGLKSKYLQVVNSNDSIYYHTDIDQLYRVFDYLKKDSLNAEALTFAAYFSEQTNDSYMRYKMVEAYENLGQIQTAIDTLEKILKADPDNEYFNNKLLQLKN